MRSKLLIPMKASLGSEKDLSLAEALFEPKLDGIRALCYANKELTFYSRNNRNITADYPEFDFRDAIEAKSAILDGEIVVLDDLLIPRFHLWQQGHTAIYIVFDILAINGKELTGIPLVERKSILDATVHNGPHIEKIIYTAHGKALWHEMIKRDMEGVIAKKQNSLYYPGKRSKVWIKIKAFKALEAIIIGYLPGKRALGSLALGLYNEKGEIIYIGNVGTGFTESFLVGLAKQLKKLEIKEVLPENMPKGIIAVKPKLVCEIKYLEFTQAGILRAPVFLRLRPDKEAQEITFKDQELRV